MIPVTAELFRRAKEGYHRHICSTGEVWLNWHDLTLFRKLVGITEAQWNDFCVLNSNPLVVDEKTYRKLLVLADSTKAPYYAALFKMIDINERRVEAFHIFTAHCKGRN